MEYQRDFKGVWIPKEIWLDKRLNMLEKGILTEINSLDNENGCTAGNDYLAKFCQCSETKVSTAIKKLIELDYIYLKSFDGRIRILKSRVSNFERQTLKDLNSEFKNLKANNINNNITRDNNKNNKKENIKEQEIFDYWNSKPLIKHKDIKSHLKAIQTALKENSIEEIKTCIDRYSTVNNDKNYYFNYDWTLTNFLKQKNAMKEFKDDGSKWISYQNRKQETTEKKQTTTGNNFTPREYTKTDYNDIFADLDNVEI